MRFIVLGTSAFTLQSACGLLASGAQIAAMVSLPKALLPDNSTDVAGFAKENNLTYLEIGDVNEKESLDVLSSFHADYLFSTWPKIIKKELLALPKYFTIGTHPTDLPHNRGRHPLHWLIVLGITQSKLSFFKMDEGVDTGALLHQEPFAVTGSDTIVTLAEKVNSLAFSGTRTLCSILNKDPSYAGKTQNHSQANYLRKRTLFDVMIDPRMSATMVLRTVQSFVPPYPAAILLVEDQVLRIVSAGISKTHLDPEEVKRMEPGKVVTITGNILCIKIEDALVDLYFDRDIPAILTNLKYVHPPAKYVLKYPGAFPFDTQSPVGSASDIPVKPGL